MTGPHDGPLHRAAIAVEEDLFTLPLLATIAVGQIVIGFLALWKIPLCWIKDKVSLDEDEAFRTVAKLFDVLDRILWIIANAIDDEVEVATIADGSGKGGQILAVSL